MYCLAKSIYLKQKKWYISNNLEIYHFSFHVTNQSKLNSASKTANLTD